MSEWIPVTERVPTQEDRRDESLEVNLPPHVATVCEMPDGRRYVASRTYVGEKYGGWNSHDPVLFWQPLPELPENNQ